MMQFNGFVNMELTLTVVLKKESKMVKYKAVNQKDIEKVRELFTTGKFSTTRIATLLNRGWSTVQSIIDSDFSLTGYKELTRSLRAERKSEKNNLTFRPFNAKKSPGPVKIADIPVKAEKDTNTFSSMNDVLEHMWNLQQDNAKEAIKVQTDDSSRTEAIHKIRDGLQKISEGLGKLL